MFAIFDKYNINDAINWSSHSYGQFRLFWCEGGVSEVFRVFWDFVFWSYNFKWREDQRTNVSLILGNWLLLSRRRLKRQGKCIVSIWPSSKKVSRATWPSSLNQQRSHSEILQWDNRTTWSSLSQMSPTLSILSTCFHFHPRSEYPLPNIELLWSWAPSKGQDLPGYQHRYPVQVLPSTQRGHLLRVHYFGWDW